MEELTLTYPTEANSRPFIEFRARKPEIAKGGRLRIGHVFVVLGRQLNDGTKVYYGAGGFYPEQETIKTVLAGPGQVPYKVEDLNTDGWYFARITGEQERIVTFLLQQWNDTKDYNIVEQNCVTLVTAVAKRLGLDFGKDTPVTPYGVIESLGSRNDADQPLRYAIVAGEAARGKFEIDLNNTRAILARMAEREREVALAEEEWARWERNRAAGEMLIGIPMPGAGGSSAGSGASPFQPNSILDYVWPWDPPGGRQTTPD